jgi:hypothetical protein
MSVDRSAHRNRTGSLLRLLLILLPGLLGFTGNAFAAGATLAWNTISGAAGYRLSYGTAPGKYTKTLNVGNKTQVRVEGLVRGKKYYFAVRAYKGSRTSPYSNVVNGVIGRQASSAESVTGGAAGLVAAFGFDESGGNRVLDASGNDNHGTLSNADRTARGKFGGALSFNGQSSLVRVADSASLALADGMTLAAWVYPETQGSSRPSIITKEMGGRFAYALHAGNREGKPTSTLVIGSSDRSLVGGASLPLRAWTHLAATYDGTTRMLFVNGVQVRKGAASGSLAASSGPLRIGGNKVMQGQFFKGLIDEVRIYDRALSHAEIAQVSNEPVVD